MILLSDPRVAALPVHECGEPLVEVGTLPGIRLDPRERDAAGAYGRVRRGVGERLCLAARQLPDGIGIAVVEGHREPAEQARRFARYENQLLASGSVAPGDAAELRLRTSVFVSPVEVAPHCAGAAVDVTLVGPDGYELDMGGAVNGHRTGDEASCPMAAGGLSATARRNRALLAEVLGAAGAGLVNYPTEWWHWSYGDRYWALMTGAPAAVYGPVGADDAQGEGRGPAGAVLP
ncbi:M15 family metallopeptidase [Streptomyces sp. 150FB]|uniref:M15 family metallopeptidase n=1 Tax=Streptomyces sp. 150FB TaxID=1576605 RepID=UPI000698D442|nr:M15 family metallopeptidase [Streptomyces sp. 150FB]